MLEELVESVSTGPRLSMTSPLTTPSPLLGSDLVYIPRIGRLWQKFGRTFLLRVFSVAEIEAWEERYGLGKMAPNNLPLVRSMAGRFAAKEAFFKAASLLGPFPFRLQWVEILSPSAKDRRPFLRFSDPLPKVLQNYDWCLSLSHDHHYAQGVVLGTLSETHSGKIIG